MFTYIYVYLYNYIDEVDIIIVHVYSILDKTRQSYIVNTHIAHFFSPIGEVFRSRLRQFPSLITCCTIDWFSEWPDEALQSVARNFLQDLTEIDSEIVDGLVRLLMI